ncbi:MAG TPA: ribosome assembly RNA-binding protein YhbY [Burkholderiaceae bacterium]|nr:ribosome assembly RNA-binding protein YhbY [Burkholderiaceae bacterium]
MPEIGLTPKERQALKARAHGLKPVVLLGNSGLSTPVMKEIDRALAAHELIKVRVPGDDRDERDAVFAEVAESLSAARVQAIGKLLVLYRPAPDEETKEESMPAKTRSAGSASASKAPARRIGSTVPAKRPGKPSAPKRSTPDRRDAERVNPGTASRRDPGASKRAAGKRNVVRRGGSSTR